MLFSFYPCSSHIIRGEKTEVPEKSTNLKIKTNTHEHRNRKGLPLIQCYTNYDTTNVRIYFELCNSNLNDFKHVFRQLSIFLTITT